MALSKKSRKARQTALKRKLSKEPVIEKQKPPTSPATRFRKFYKKLSVVSKSMMLQLKRRNGKKFDKRITPRTRQKLLLKKTEERRRKYANMTPTTRQKLLSSKRIKKKIEFSDNICKVPALVQGNELFSRITFQTTIKQKSLIDYSRHILSTAEFICAICFKNYFKYQVISIFKSCLNLTLLPAEIPDNFTCCNKCHNTLKKKRIPCNAYWNNMLVKEIPIKLKQLSEVEVRLLSRITPFLKIVRLQGACGQFGLKGQAILFAQEVEEIAEQLPLASDRIKMIIVGESLNNVKKYSEYSVSVEHLRSALNWLVHNNQLYLSVEINIPDDMENLQSQLMHVLMPEKVRESTEHFSIENENAKVGNENMAMKTSFTCVGENTYILHGNFNQGSVNFDEEIRGKQCTAVAAAANVLAHIKNLASWNSADIDRVLMAGSSYYKECIREKYSQYIYLSTTDLKDEIKMGANTYNVTVLPDYIVGVTYCPTRSQLPSNVYCTLEQGLLSFFEDCQYGILTISMMSMAVMRQSNEFWLCDSHSRGPKGCVARNKGRAMLMNFSHCENLARHVLKLVKCFNNRKREQYTISGLLALIVGNEELHMQENCLEENNLQIPTNRIENDNEQTIEEIKENYKNDGALMTTALMPINVNIPALEDLLSMKLDDDGEPIPIYKLLRKTAPPVSSLIEMRAEELAWFYLFPDGKNGLNEEREIPITVLEYYQTRVMSSDKRFQRLDYLFYALSTVELYKANQNISVCGRLQQNGIQPVKLVDNIHLSMRNIRGSGSYWHTAYCNLLAMVRNLGPPSWYITLSCNDMNWGDILQALLKADNRPDENPHNLSFLEKKELIDKYPITLSRQFMHRFNGFMKILKQNDSILGGPIVDFWWRIEFQLRGSPHVHMVVWCSDLPKFDSPEGVNLIDRVVSCMSSTGDKILDELVNRLQKHKHTPTCFKKNNVTTCRFGFPRKCSAQTIILGPDEALRNGGRFCILKRDTKDCMVNNYNKDFLMVWQANVDIQPCGNALGVAYYISKYVAKSEPIAIAQSIQTAIQKVNAFGGDFRKQMFAVSMAMFNHRQVSASECAFRLCHLKLRDSSRKCVFVNTCIPEQRFRMLRLDRGDVFDNIFEKYSARPLHLDELSLGEFAVNYESAANPNKCAEDMDIDVEEMAEEERPKRTEFIKLMNNKGRMKKRSRPAILRTRYFTSSNDPENYYYSLLVTHLPFRNENELLENFESVRDAFFAKRNLLRPINANLNNEYFMNIESELNDAIRRIVAENIATDLEREPHCEIQVDNDVVIRNDDNEVCGKDLQELQDLRMSDESYNKAVQTLNVEQKKLFSLISKKLMNNETNQILIFITGGAGSGKTFTLKLIVEQIHRLSHTMIPGLSPVAIAAPTGVAAKLINGNTLHSTFCLPIEKGGPGELRPLSGDRLRLERSKWKHINWLIIDEISMVSYIVLRMVHLRLQELKQNDKLFGGVNILLFGDLMQLPPIMKGSKVTHCYRQPQIFNGEINLWRCFSFCELMVNMRQENDNTFVDLLNNLRVGNLTMEQLEILDSRRIRIEEKFDDIIRIFPTIKQVDEYNKTMSEKLKLKTNLYVVHAIDKSIENKTYGQIPESKFISPDPNKTAGMVTSITIGIGSRMMLRRNINVRKGLVNGSMGTIVSIKWPALRRQQLESGELPVSIGIKFDDIADSVEIQPLTTSYDGLRGYGKIERKMLPIILCWAVTVHKLQGVTLNTAVVDMGPKLFAKGQAYVALSRVKSLEGLIVSNLHVPRLLNNPHDKHSLEELLRLRNLK